MDAESESTKLASVRVRLLCIRCPQIFVARTRSGDVSILLSAILGGPASIINLSKALRARRHANLAARVNSCINDLKEAKGIMLVQKMLQVVFVRKMRGILPIVLQRTRSPRSTFITIGQVFFIF